MTETLNYDPTPADQPEFSEDEQNSLEVAEKLGQQESELYAGKFENAEELENAYLELQKKLGSGDTDDEVSLRRLCQRSLRRSKKKGNHKRHKMLVQD